MATHSFSLVTFIQELRRFLLTRAHIASKKFVIPLHSACDKYTYAPWVYFVLLLCVHLCIQYKSCIWRLEVDVGSLIDPGTHWLARLVVRSKSLPFSELGLWMCPTMPAFIWILGIRVGAGLHSYVTGTLRLHCLPKLPFILLVYMTNSYFLYK